MHSFPIDDSEMLRVELRVVKEESDQCFGFEVGGSSQAVARFEI
jgi:hypothetical protein